MTERAIPSERQSAELGVRVVKGPFHRVSVPLPADVRSRFRVISTLCYMFNFWTRLVGLNQILSAYSGNNEDAQPWVLELVDGNNE